MARITAVSMQLLGRAKGLGYVNLNFSILNFKLIFNLLNTVYLLPQMSSLPLYAPYYICTFLLPFQLFKFYNLKENLPNACVNISDAVKWSS